MTDNYSLSDIAAVTDGNRNNGMFGNDSWAWIVILLLFGYGRGFGGFGGGYGGGGVGENCVLATDFANIERKLDGVNNGICDSTFALNNTINGNFRTLDNAICTLGYQGAQHANAIQSQLAQCLKKIFTKTKAVGTCVA